MGDRAGAPAPQSQPPTVRIEAPAITTMPYARLAAALQVPADRDLAALAEAALTEIERLRGVETEAEGLRQQAELGRRFRAERVTAALEAGTAALADDFNRTVYEGLFNNPSTSLDLIDQQAKDWAAIRVKRLGGGRLTKEQGDPDPNKKSDADRGGDVHFATIDGERSASPTEARLFG